MNLFPIGRYVLRKSVLPWWRTYFESLAAKLPTFKPSAHVKQSSDTCTGEAMLPFKARKAGGAQIMEDFGRFANFAQLRDFLKDALYEHLFAAPGKSDQAKKYRFEHCLRVAKIGREIAFADSTTTQPLDPQLLEIGCLLHDIGKWDATVAVDHGRAGALIAYPLLRAAGLKQTLCQELAQGIAMHVDTIWNPGANGGTYENHAGEK